MKFEHQIFAADNSSKALTLPNSLSFFLFSPLSLFQVIVISWDTACGKATQLLHFILESEIEAGRGDGCSILCTQPRRISAISVVTRVAAERGEEIGGSVRILT